MDKSYKNLKDKAYEIIKEKIITCELAPGSLFSENDLLKEIGSSRTPVREALNKLENEKLIKIFPKRGFFVTDISLKDVVDIYNIREAIEPLAARLATPYIDISSLEQYIKIYSASHADYTLQEHIKIDREFHTLVANSTDNPYLSQFLMGIYDQNSRIRILSKLRVKERQDEAREEHNELIKCFIARDANKAEEVMKRHIFNGRMTALKVVQK